MALCHRATEGHGPGGDRVREYTIVAVRPNIRDQDYGRVRRNLLFGVDGQVHRVYEVIGPQLCGGNRDSEIRGMATGWHGLAGREVAGA